MRNVLRKVQRRPSNLSRARSVTLKQSQRMTSRRTQLQLLWDLANATLGGDCHPSLQQLEALRHAICELTCQIDELLAYSIIDML